MRLVSYVVGDRQIAGVVTHDDRVIAVSSLDGQLPDDMLGLLSIEGALERLQSTALPAGGVPVDSIEFAPVVPNPRAIWCAALTYNSHVSEAAGRRAPLYPLFFPRVQESQVGHRQPLVRPVVSDLLDYEGELAVVIGRRARHIPVEDALSYVAGYSCYNDGSVRDWQSHTPQISPGKNFEHTGGFGPWLMTTDQFGDPYNHRIVTRVNREVRQDDSIDSLLFRIEYQIHYLSTMHTLNPGDVLVTGTPGGVGMRREPPVFLNPGDVVTVEIDGIGTLENRVLLEEPEASSTWSPAQGQEATV
jgi:2-keto-4-pentenoate hydratase/2-oxohepta-3-ene-1,7-dioic acid hydratase in catechol pathway